MRPFTAAVRPSLVERLPADAPELNPVAAG
jgi:hypothetical protein